MEPMYVCCICNEEKVGYGNNPEPFMKNPDENGNLIHCCDECNMSKVIPARLGK